MVLAERRAFGLLFHAARTGSVERIRHIGEDSDSESEEEDEELARIRAAQRRKAELNPPTANPIVWATRQLDDLLEMKDLGSEVPSYPILNYVVNGEDYASPPRPTRRVVADDDDSDSDDGEEEDSEEQGEPCTYAEALSLNMEDGEYGDAMLANALSFREEFAAMLQQGFKLVKHAPHHEPKSHRLWLSPDRKQMWWQPLNDRGPPQARFPVADIHIVLSYPPEQLVPLGRSPASFMLVFDLGLSAAAAKKIPEEQREVRRRMVVFETVNVETKHLLVDGFRLLKWEKNNEMGTAAASSASSGLTLSPVVPCLHQNTHDSRAF